MCFQKHLKNTEKRLKRGKITEDGLNFSRGNLAISYLATGDKRAAGQAKRYLKYLTPKLYKTREWTYNMAVAYYVFSSLSARKNRDGSRKETTASLLNIKEEAYEKQNKKMRSDHKKETGKDLGSRQTTGKGSRRVSFACRFGGMAGGMTDDNGEPSKLAMALKKWGFSSKGEATSFCNANKES